MCILYNQRDATYVVRFPGGKNHRGCIFHSPVVGFTLLVFEAATYTTNTIDEYPCPQRYMKRRSQQSSSHGHGDLYGFVLKGLPQKAEVALGFPGRLRPRIISRFGTARVVGRQPNAPAAFTPGEIPSTHFQR